MNVCEIKMCRFVCSNVRTAIIKLDLGPSGGSLLRAALGVSSTPYGRRYLRNGGGRPQHSGVEHIAEGDVEEGVRGWNLSSSRMVTRRSVRIDHSLAVIRVEIGHAWVLPLFAFSDAKRP